MPVEVEYSNGVQMIMNHSDEIWMVDGTPLESGAGIPLEDSATWAISAQGDSLKLAQKFIPLEGTCNFRDLGGLVTPTGKQVKYGWVFRSDKLSELTETDRATLSARSLTKVIDFRNDKEVEAEPDALSEGMQYVHLPIGDFDPSNFWNSLSEVKNDEDGADSLMMALYTTFPLRYANQYKAFFQELTDSNATPTVFHCTAGKDRTGLAAALFYYALGIDLETITKDYANSTYYRFEHNAKYINMMKIKGIKPEVAQVIMGVKQEYMYEIFRTIEAKYETVDRYLSSALGVDDSVKMLLRARYLQD